MGPGFVIHVRAKGIGPGLVILVRISPPGPDQRQIPALGPDKRQD